jgi:hypothetical protein
MDVRSLYNRFDVPVTAGDCGSMCAPHNPSGKPFCCDICHAVPAAYHQEWDYLRRNTDLWHVWRGDECGEDAASIAEMHASTPAHMRLLACKGPTHCERPLRALSCRQFPFFPYITADLRFIGLAYEWAFEPTCWVISHLDAVTDRYRREFVTVYDQLFDLWPEEFNGYAVLSDEMRDYFSGERRRIPLLHRNGGYYLLSPGSERLARVSPESYPRFGPYIEPRQQP